MAEKPCGWCMRAGAKPEILMWGTLRICRRCARDEGGLVGRRALALHDIGPVENFTPEVLKRLAEGGIMDSNALFLPAGKLSREDAAAREAANIKRL